MKEEKYIAMDIDSLATECPYFTGLTDANNGYGCNHPEQEEFEELYKEDGYTYRGFEDDESKPKTRQGKCYSFSCPIAFKCTTIEELKEYDPDTADEIIRNNPNVNENKLDSIADTYDIMVVKEELINEWRGGLAMTKEQKQLLMKDLCGRLPYGVNVLHVKEDIIGVLSTINIYLGNNAEGKQELICTTSFFGEGNVPIEEFKPYLYPLSSMTEKQKKEYRELLRPSVYKSLDEDDDAGFPTLISANPSVVEVDYFNKHHLDYRGLIEQGLAIDATGVIEYSKQEEP